jgi:hypothetical protein
MKDAGREMVMTSTLCLHIMKFYGLYAYIWMAFYLWLNNLANALLECPIKLIIYYLMNVIDSSN